MKEIVIDNIPDKRKYGFETVERKGKGHPDTLADKLAEHLSKIYSNYTIQKYGYTLHHSFDRLVLLGGSSYVSFGKGYMKNPIKTILASRITTRFKDESIPVSDILSNAVYDFFKKELPLLSHHDLEIKYEISTQTSPCYLDTGPSEQKYWFTPRKEKELMEHNPRSTDMVIAAAYYPLSELEDLVLKLEMKLNSEKYHKENPWLGYDIKILAIRQKRLIKMVLAIPQIANYVNSLKEYQCNLEYIKEHIIDFIRESYPQLELKELIINPRDDYTKKELYLTTIGTSLERGDKGIVGRGNRYNGLITPTRPMSIEGRCGKPWYASGKIYNILAQEIARKISECTGSYVEVYITSYHWHKLNKPWLISIKASNELNPNDVNKIVNEIISFSYIKELVSLWLRGEYNVCF